VDRRHLRKATVRAGRRNNEGHYPFREPTAADRFDARFAAELQRRWLAVELSASYRAIHLDSGAYINAADRLTALLRAPERGAP
jgi:hypothetical protein